MKKIYFLLLTFVIMSISSNAQTVLSPGDIAIVGYQYSGTPDAFAIMLLKNVAANTEIYFTDNGWLTAGGFRGVTSTNSAGNEGLVKLKLNTAISAGTFIRSDETNAAFTWTTSGTIPNTASGSSGSFSALAFSSSGDQIYCFQGPSNNPQYTPTALYCLDYTNGFENATDSGTGDIPPGLTAGSTAFTHTKSTSLFYLNTAKTGFSTSRSSSEWITYIANTANWTGAADTTSTLIPNYSTSTATLGTNNFDFSELSYFPNPTQSYFSINNSQPITYASVWSLLGQKVKEFSFDPKNTVNLDLSSLNNGTYLLKIISEGKEKTIKIVKN